MNDLRQAFRSLRRSPGFAAAAILTLGLGMGASTAVFTLLKRVVLDPLPYPESARLVRLKNQVPGVAPDEEWQLSTAQYFYYREHAGSMEDIGLFQRGAVNVATPGDPVRARTAVVTPGLLRLIGARARNGRRFSGSSSRRSSRPIVVSRPGQSRIPSGISRGRSTLPLSSGSCRAFRCRQVRSAFCSRVAFRSIRS